MPRLFPQQTERFFQHNCFMFANESGDLEEKKKVFCVLITASPFLLLRYLFTAPPHFHLLRKANKDKKWKCL